MVKKTRRRSRARIAAANQQQPVAAPLAPATPQAALGYDPKGQMQQRRVVSAKEAWSEYTLDDGTIIKSRNALVDVKRAVGQFDLAGQPLYVVQGAFVLNVAAPKKLMKK
jgi:hypothetical protein